MKRKHSVKEGELVVSISLEASLTCKRRF
jgi:hypothetical protein